MNLLPLLLPTLLVAQTPQSMALSDLRWLQGRWTGERGPERFEEQWSLQGQSLLGVARTLEKDQTTFVELFMLESGEEGWVLRIRMFGPALDKALRGKDTPLRLVAVEMDASHVLFEGMGPETGTRVLYRLEGPGRLLAEISKTKNGKPWKETFHLVKGD